jgi:hypothetical protein
MQLSSTLRRAAGIAATAALLASLVGAVPATASARRAASAAPAAPAASTHVRGSIINRGHINATQAAKAAVGVRRPKSTHRTLGVPVPANVRRTGTTPRRASVSVSPNIATPASPFAIYNSYGISETGDGIALEPPDPWIAVNSTYLVQSVNSLVRIYDRSANYLLDVPTWALFGLAPGEVDADPRIIWDAAHSRWLGVELSFTTNLSGIATAYLNLAVSDGADPRGSWQVISYEYGDGVHATLPDYPGIGSSTTSIVLTANEFDYTETTFLGASMLVFRWSDILAGNTGNPAQWTAPDPGLFTIRPAIIQGSTTSDIHLVAESNTDGSLLYQRLATPTTAASWSTNLTARYGDLAPASLAPVPPHQPGPSTISRAVDFRITDAVWHAGALAFVTTMDLTGVDYVRVIVLNTTTAIPTVISDSAVGPGGSTDSYMGGVGFTQSGALITVFTESSTVLNPGTWATQSPAPYSAWSAPASIQTGASTYSGNRWGDFVGVAIDPLGTNTVWTADEVPASDHTWTTRVERVSVDITPPVVSTPAQALLAGTHLGAFTVPVRVSWTATDPGSGFLWSIVGLSEFGGSMNTTTQLPGTSFTRSEYWKYSTNPGDFSYQYAVYCYDQSNNSSVPLYSAILTPTVYEQTKATYSGTWATHSSYVFSNGSTKYSTKAGASASFKTSGRSFAFVTTKASNRGKAKVYVDGVLKTTLTLKSTAAKYGNLAYVINFAVSGTHTIKVVVVSGRVDVDAFVVLR